MSADLPSTSSELSSDGPQTDAGESEIEVGRSALRDTATADDTLGFEPYVTAVAAFLIHPGTVPPLTMSIEGEWGSGKSSFMLQLQERMKTLSAERSKEPRTEGDPVPVKPRFVRFNAWRHDTDNSLWAAFALEFIRQLRDRRPWRGLALAMRRFDIARGWPKLLQALALFGFVIVLTLITLAHLLSVSRQGGFDAILHPTATTSPTARPTPGAPANPNVASDASAPKPEVTSLLVQYLLGLGGAAGYLGLVVLALSKARGSLSHLSAVTDLREFVRDPNYRSKVDFIETFHEDLARIITTYVEDDERVYIFIDDLDRSSLPKAGQLLAALNLLMSGDQGATSGVPPRSKLVFVLGIDRDKVAASLAAQYRDVLPFMDVTETRIYPDGAQGQALKGIDYGYQFLERFIQVPFRVPRSDSDAVGKFLKELRKPPPRLEPDRRKWAQAFRAFIHAIGTPFARVSAAVPMLPAVEPAQQPTTEQARFNVYLGDADSDRIDRIVQLVAPALEFNPRRLKQFLNVFRLRAFIGSETGIFAALSLDQLAKLTAVDLAFPRFFSQIAVDPDSLHELLRFAYLGTARRFATIRNGDDEYLKLSAEMKYWANNELLMSLLESGATNKDGRLEPSHVRVLLEVAARRREFRLTASLPSKSSTPSSSPSSSPAESSSSSTLPESSSSPAESSSSSTLPESSSSSSSKARAPSSSSSSTSSRSSAPVSSSPPAASPSRKRSSSATPTASPSTSPKVPSPAIGGKTTLADVRALFEKLGRSGDSAALNAYFRFEKRANPNAPFSLEDREQLMRYVAEEVPDPQRQREVLAEIARLVQGAM